MGNPARFAADLASKMASDPRIMRVILDNADGIRAASPDLAMRLDDGDPNAVLEAYQMIVAGGGRVNPPASAPSLPPADDPAARRSAHAAMRDGWPAAYDADADEVMAPDVFQSFSPEQQSLVRELEANDWLGFDYPSQAVNATLSPDARSFEMTPELTRARAALLAAQAAAPARQLQLPLGDGPTGLVPYGVRGPGVPVGGPRGAGVRIPPPTSLSPYVTPRLGLPEPPRGLPEPPRGLPEPPRGLPAPQRGDLDRARQIAADVVRRSAIPAAAAGIGAAAWSLLPDKAEAPNVDAAEPAPRMVPNVMRKPQAFSTADLAAETAPPPSVAVEDESITLDYAQMARDKIRQANEIQLREGRITPESAALTREADALYQKAAEARRTGFHPPIMPVEQQNEQTSAIRARQRRAG